jgi:PhnB protein
MNTNVTARESLVPSLLFNGDAGAALELYRRTFGGALNVRRFAGTPAENDVPSDWGDKVLFGELRTPEGVVITAMDAPPSRAVQIGGNVALYYHCATNERAEAIFSHLAGGGTVRMPLGKTFFSECFGMVADAFGIAWLVSVRDDDGDRLELR